MSLRQLKATRWIQRLTRVALLALIALVGGLLITQFAFGHAELMKANIADGAVFSLTQVPGQVVLNFGEDLDTKRSSIYVVKLGEDILVDRGDLSVQGSQMAISLNALQTGVYQIHWVSITPDDGGFRSGTITFSVKIGR